MYKFRKEKLYYLLQGKTITECAEGIGISRVYLSNIINGRLVNNKKIAYAITKFAGAEYEIRDFFEIDAE